MIQLGLWPSSDRSDNSDEHDQSVRLGQISWSYTRRSLLEQCVRRYYYRYFGSSKRTAKEADNKDALHFLRQLKTRHERVGGLLHLAIRTYLKKSQTGDMWSGDRLSSWARQIFLNDVAFSRAYSKGDDLPTGPYPPALLTEYYYRDPEADDKCEQAKERLTNALVAFVTDAQYHSFRQSGARPESLIEHKLKGKLSLPCQVEGQVDLAYRHLGAVTVVDWKLGYEDGVGDDSLQLATYALWAVDHYDCAPEALRICKVHFSSSAVVDFNCDSSLLTSARARIIQDAERMLLMSQYGQDGIVEAFSPCLKPAVCLQCPFLEVCPEGRAMIYG